MSQEKDACASDRRLSRLRAGQPARQLATDRRCPKSTICIVRPFRTSRSMFHIRTIGLSGAASGLDYCEDNQMGTVSKRLGQRLTLPGI